MYNYGIVKNMCRSTEFTKEAKIRSISISELKSRLYYIKKATNKFRNITTR